MPRDRKPADLKVLHGNPGKEKAPVMPGKSATGKPSPPLDLRGEAFAEWCRITSYLESVGHIEAVDYAALVVYVTAWSMFDMVRKAMEEHGPLVVGRDGALVKNPAAQVMRDSSDTMLKYGAKFGFSPKDRMNLGIGKTDAEEDGFTSWMAG